MPEYPQALARLMPASSRNPSRETHLSALSRGDAGRLNFGLRPGRRLQQMNYHQQDGTMRYLKFRQKLRLPTLQ